MIQRLLRPGGLRPARIRPHGWAAALALGLVLPVAGSASATPVISELFYDAVGSDDGQGFVELYGAPGTVLDGLTLEGVNGSNGSIGPVVTLLGVIGADGLYVVADEDGSGATAVAGADQIANFDFQNGPDSVVLHDGPLVLDAVGYGVFALDEVFAGEGAAAEDAPAGSSLQRVFADIDTDDNAFDFVVADVPTPGAAPLSVPEPGSASLGLTGLAGLALWRRHRR